MEVRKVKRTSFCRGCDKENMKGELVGYMYSMRNRGQHIYLCPSCICKLYNILVEGEYILEELK